MLLGDDSMASRDSYFNKLTEIVTDLENLYELNKENELGLVWVKANITDIVKHVQQSQKERSKDEIYELNKVAGKQVILLSYLSQRLHFFGKSELSFKDYPFLKEIVDILMRFTKRSSISGDSMRKVNRVIAILSDIDAKYVQFRFSLGYRYLRIFITMLLYQNFWNASVIANMIIEQIMAEGESL